MKKLLFLLMFAGFIMVQQNLLAQQVIEPTSVNTTYNPTLSGPTSVQIGDHFLYYLDSLPTGWSVDIRTLPMVPHSTSNLPEVLKFTTHHAQIRFKIRGEHIVQFDIYDNTGAYWGWRSLRVFAN